MKFGVYITFFLLSTVKFMFTPFAGPAAKLSFLETYLICISGASICAAFFYYLSEFFIKRAHSKRVMQYLKATELNQPFLIKKKFTKTNKIIVRTKKSLGIYGIALYAPFFLSVPIGSIIAAKFYGKDKRTFPLVVLGMVTNGFITTSLAYLFKISI